MISDRHRCIFVHVPKTAGVTVETILWPGERTEHDLWMGFVDEHHNRYQTGGLQHLLATQIRDAVGSERFESYFKFTFVRNPFDRIVSQYGYMRRRPDLRAFVGMAEDATFSEYLELIGSREHVQWMPQTAFILDDDGTELVDYIGRFEHFADDLRTVLARLGVKVRSIPHRNRSERAPYRTYYSDADRSIVESRFRDDLERFGYEF